MIASLHNPLVKHFVKLREEKHYRWEQRSVLITGYKLVQEVAARRPPKQWIVTEPCPMFITGKVQHVTPTVMKKITGLPSPEPIAAEFPLPEPQSLTHKAPLLALDGIRDPGNLGTLIRTALALGWSGVFFLPTCVDLFHEKALRSARAAPFYFPWQIGSWDELHQIAEMGNLKTYIADTEGDSIQTLQPSSQILLVLSNEAQGVQSHAKKNGYTITIPICGDMESLNVAIAGAILMYELIP